MQGEKTKVIHLSVHKNNTGNREDQIQEKDLFQAIIHNKYSQGILSVFIWQAPWKATKQTPFIFFLIQHVGQSGVHISDTSKHSFINTRWRDNKTVINTA